MTAIDIPGSVGRIEAHFDAAADGRGTLAILCHPHPQYGGSMHDGVLDIAARVMLDHGIDCIRFNFRGVGGSDGRYDDGVGEVDDLIAVANWATENHADHELWLAGYSFGSSIVFKALSQLETKFALLIAPPVGMMAFPDEIDTSAVHAIAGDQDNFVDSEQFIARFGDRANLLNGADHFFGGYQNQLSDAVAQAIATALSA